MAERETVSELLRSAQLRDDRMRAFAEFVLERQRIWYRRVTLGEPPPWTDDAVLRAYHFTNIYREEDRGTRYLFKIIDNHRMLPIPTLVFNVLFYRAINNIDTWRKYVGFVVTYDDAVASWKNVLAAYNRGEAPFTKAWQVNQATPDSIDEGVTGRKWNAFTIDHAARRAQTLGPVNDVISKYPLMQKFTGYQVALDLLHVYPDLRCADEDVRISLTRNSGQDSSRFRGSGAALLDLFGIEASDEAGHELKRSGVLLLRKVHDALPRIVPPWHSVSLDRQPIPELYNIEHALCEWQKYEAQWEKLREGRVTTGRRRFRMRSEELP